MSSQDAVPIYTNDTYGNGFSKIAIGIGLIWIGTLIFKNTVAPSSSKQYHQHKRYVLKSKNKINKQIEAKNRAVKLPPKVDIFTRNKRFNRYF